MKSIAIFLLLIVTPKLVDGQQLPNKEQFYKTIEVENPIPLTRNNETITLSKELIKEAFPNQNVKFVQVKDLKKNKLLITQPVDYNNDGIIDEFLFQNNFNPNEKKKFALSLKRKKM